MAENDEKPVSGIEAFIKDIPEEVVAEQPTEELTPQPEVTGKPEEAAPQEVKPTDAQNKFFEEINKRFSKSYKSEEEVLEAFNSLAKMPEYDAKLREATEHKTKLDELTNAQKAWLAEKEKLEARVNPLAFFRDEKAYVAEQLRRQFPDKDPAVIERIVTSDLSRMDKLELLAHRLLLDTPEIDGGLEGAKEYVLSELGVEQGSKPEEWDRITKNKVAARASQAKKDLEELTKSVEIPRVKTEADLQAEVAAHQDGLKKVWTPFLDKMEAIDKLQIPAEDGTVLTTIDIPQEWRQAMKAELQDMILASGLEPTGESIKELNAAREMKFIHANLPKLYTIWRNQIESKAIEERDKLLNNTQPPNTSIKPDEKPDTTGLGMKTFLDSETRMF